MYKILSTFNGFVGRKFIKDGYYSCGSENFQRKVKLIYDKSAIDRETLRDNLLNRLYYTVQREVEEMFILSKNYHEDSLCDVRYHLDFPFSRYYSKNTRSNCSYGKSNNTTLTNYNPPVFLFILYRNVQICFTIHSQNLTTKADSKNDKVKMTATSPPLSPVTPNTSLPATSQSRLSPPSVPQSSDLTSRQLEARALMREEQKHTITLAELTDVEKRDIIALSKMSGEKKKPQVQKKSILKKIVDELKHYYHGFRLLFIDIRVSASLVFRILRGHSLRRREKRLLERTVGDLFRLIPFSIFIIVPFMELTLPIFIKLFPGMLPTTFQSKADKEEKLRNKLKIKLEMAKFLQETLFNITVTGKHGCIQCQEDAKEFSKFFEKVRSGKGVASNEEILRFSHLFSDTITLDTLPRPQLVALCRVLDIQPFGTTAFLRFQIETRLRTIHADDQVIQKEGVNSLDLLELQQACATRGMRALGLSEAQLRAQLQQWIELTLNLKVPETLLLLSRAFMFHEPTETTPEETAQHIAHAISSLPESAAFIAKEHVGALEGKMDRKKEADLIKQQYKMIKEERKEERAERLRLRAARVAAGEKEPVSEKVDDAKQEYAFIESEPAEVKGLLVCRAKKPVDIISTEDTYTIQKAVETLSRELFALEREELRTLKDKFKDYKSDLALLGSLPEKDIHESKAAERLYKYTKKMTTRLDKSIQRLEEREQALKDDLMPKTPEDLRKKVFRIEELLHIIKSEQSARAVPNKKLQTIADVLSKMVISSKEGTIRLETLLKMIKLLQRTDLSLTTQQMDEVIEMIKKEELIALHNQIEKTLEAEEKQEANNTKDTPVPAAK